VSHARRHHQPGIRKLERKTPRRLCPGGFAKSRNNAVGFFGSLILGLCHWHRSGASLGAVRRAVLIVPNATVSDIANVLVKPLHPDSTRRCTWQWIVFSSMNVFSKVMPDGHSETRQRGYRPRVGSPREKLFARCMTAKANRIGGWPGLLDSPPRSCTETPQYPRRTFLRTSWWRDKMYIYDAKPIFQLY
jgi:hypothetical protein